MKKVWIAIAALVAVLAAALLFMGLFAPKEKQESGDAESLYAYHYEKADGGLTLIITGHFPAGYRWGVVHGGSGVEIVPQKQSAKQASFLLKPVSAGEETLFFDLQRDAEGLTERIYEIEVTALVSTGNEISILKNTHRELDGIAQGEDEGIRYRVAPLGDGSLQVVLQTDGTSRWDMIVDGSSVSAVVETVESGIYTVQVSYEELGQSTVWLCERDSDRAVQLYVSADLLKNVTLADHQVTSGRPENNKGEGLSDAAVFRRVYGSIQLPEAAFGRSESLAKWDGADGRFEVGCVEFSLSGRYWQLYLSDEMSWEAFLDQANEVSSQIVTLSAGKVYLSQMESEARAIWSNDGRSYLLTGRDASADDLKAVLAPIMTAVQNG